MAGEVIGYGAEIKIGNALAVPVLTEILNVTSLGQPQMEVGETETTHLKSPGRFREFLATLIDGGEVGVMHNYVPGSATDLMLTALVALDRVWEITLPTTVGASKKWKKTGPCYVKSYNPTDVEVDGVLQAELVLRITGPFTQAAGV